MDKQKSIKNNKQLFCNVHGFDLKELEDNLKVSGFIATTHLDDGWYSEDGLVRDKISKEALNTWAEVLNDGNPQSNKVSINHDRGDKVVHKELLSSSFYYHLKTKTYLV